MAGRLRRLVVRLTARDFLLHCVSKNDTDVALYNFNENQPILAIFSRRVAERVHYPTSPN